MKYYVETLNDKGTVAVDDTILVKGACTTAGSRILEGFKPLFSAEAVERLQKAGYEISGKTHVGEFGLDLVGEFSYYSEKEKELRGAAAEAVREGKVKAALGVDINGAPRRAAALSEISFLKPTYGTVSRYGIVSTATSGEQIGVYSESVLGIKEIMEAIAGHDEKDGTSLKEKSYSYDISGNVSGKKVCIIKELYELSDDETKARIKSFAEKLSASGAVVEEVSSDIFETAATAWQIIMSAETCNNVSRYDGVKFGYRAPQYKNIDELYVNTRTEGFNFLTKAVILYGSDVLSKNRYEDCFSKSLKVRRVVAEGFKKLMEAYDAVLTPVCSKAAYESYDISDAFMKVFRESVFTAVPNLIGTPALATKGVQLMGAHFSESTLLSLAYSAEKEGK